MFSLAFFSIGFTHESKHHHAQKEKGITAAGDWLILIDKKKYQETWEKAAQFFKSSLTAEQWKKTAVTVREPLGELISREPFHDRLATTLPGMPDGHYLILRYVSKFANKANAVESVTVMVDADGKWRVTGYFIK